MANSEWVSSMKSLLGSLSGSETVKACSISGVPEPLRKLGKEAEPYKPKVVSIGPLFRGTKTELQHMEEIKYRCMLSLFLRSDEPIRSFDKCSEAILSLDMVVRAFYVDDIKFNNYDLAKIMFLDGCFLLELLISNAEQSGYAVVHSDGVSSSLKFATEDVRKMGVLISDLKLLGNQIPLLVLDLLYRELFIRFGDSIMESESDTLRGNKINGLALFLFGCNPSPYANDSTKRAHLLDIVHDFITRIEDEKNKIVPESNLHSITVEVSEEERSLEKRNYENKPQLNCCAYRLLSDGIKLAPAKVERENVEQNLQNNHSYHETGSVHLFGCYKSFSEGTLEIQPLIITEENEIQWRNFVAWENNRATHENYIGGKHEQTSLKFSEFALSLKSLVCCEHDVKLLRRKHILVADEQWSNEDLTKFFRTIARGIKIDTTLAYKHGKMMNTFNQYSGERRNFRLFWLWHKFRRVLINTRYSLRDMFATLKRDHTPTVWKTIGVAAAVVLLFLTVAQTVFAALGL